MDSGTVESICSVVKTEDDDGLKHTGMKARSSMWHSHVLA